MSRTDHDRMDEREPIAVDDGVLPALRQVAPRRHAALSPKAGNDPIELRGDTALGPSRSVPLREDAPAAPARPADPAANPAARPDAKGDGAPRKKRKKRRKKAGSAKAISGNRGVDTLLRNSYRAQLDMLALAATKANIMISLNGLLMSLLMLSGAHFLSIDPLYAIPMALFFLGCATATVFAVLAARPDVSSDTHELDAFERDDARLLHFEEFSDLDESQYIGAMTRMLSDPSRVYRGMLAHMHVLGGMADRKYQRLYYSYTVFMIGFVLAACALVVVQGVAWFGMPATA